MPFDTSTCAQGALDRSAAKRWRKVLGVQFEGGTTDPFPVGNPTPADAIPIIIEDLEAKSFRRVLAKAVSQGNNAGSAASNCCAVSCARIVISPATLARSIIFYWGSPVSSSKLTKHSPQRRFIS
jgi:hypothetical protein